MALFWRNETKRTSSDSVNKNYYSPRFTYTPLFIRRWYWSFLYQLEWLRSRYQKQTFFSFLKLTFKDFFTFLKNIINHFVTLIRLKFAKYYVYRSSIDDEHPVVKYEESPDLQLFMNDDDYAKLWKEYHRKNLPIYFYFLKYFFPDVDGKAHRIHHYFLDLCCSIIENLRNYEFSDEWREGNEITAFVFPHRTIWSTYDNSVAVLIAIFKVNDRMLSDDLLSRFDHDRVVRKSLVGSTTINTASFSNSAKVNPNKVVDRRGFSLSLFFRTFFLKVGQLLYSLLVKTLAYLTLVLIVLPVFYLFLRGIDLIDLYDYKLSRRNLENILDFTLHYISGSRICLIYDYVNGRVRTVLPLPYTWYFWVMFLKNIPNLDGIYYSIMMTDEDSNLGIEVVLYKLIYFFPSSTFVQFILDFLALLWYKFVWFPSYEDFAHTKYLYKYVHFWSLRQPYCVCEWPSTDLRGHIGHCFSGYPKCHPPYSLFGKNWYIKEFRNTIFFYLDEGYRLSLKLEPYITTIFCFIITICTWLVAYQAKFCFLFPYTYIKSCALNPYGFNPLSNLIKLIDSLISGTFYINTEALAWLFIKIFCFIVPFLVFICSLTVFCILVNHLLRFFVFLFKVLFYAGITESPFFTVYLLTYLKIHWYRFMAMYKGLYLIFWPETGSKLIKFEGLFKYPRILVSRLPSFLRHKDHDDTNKSDWDFESDDEHNDQDGDQMWMWDSDAEEDTYESGGEQDVEVLNWEHATGNVGKFVQVVPLGSKNIPDESSSQTILGGFVVRGLTSEEDLRGYYGVIWCPKRFGFREALRESYKGHFPNWYLHVPTVENFYQEYFMISRSSISTSSPDHLTLPYKVRQSSLKKRPTAHKFHSYYSFYLLTPDPWPESDALDRFLLSRLYFCNKSLVKINKLSWDDIFFPEKVVDILKDGLVSSANRDLIKKMIEHSSPRSRDWFFHRLSASDYYSPINPLQEVFPFVLRCLIIYFAFCVYKFGYINFLMCIFTFAVFFVSLWGGKGIAFSDNYRNWLEITLSADQISEGDGGTTRHYVYGAAQHDVIFYSQALDNLTPYFNHYHIVYEMYYNFLFPSLLFFIFTVTVVFFIVDFIAFHPMQNHKEIEGNLDQIQNFDVLYSPIEIYTVRTWFTDYLFLITGFYLFQWVDFFLEESYMTVLFSPIGGWVNEMWDILDYYEWDYKMEVVVMYHIENLKYNLDHSWRVLRSYGRRIPRFSRRIRWYRTKIHIGWTEPGWKNQRPKKIYTTYRGIRVYQSFLQFWLPKHNSVAWYYDDPIKLRYRATHGAVRQYRTRVFRRKVRRLKKILAERQKWWYGWF